MKIVKGFPPNYKKIKEKFNPPYGVVFTYGDTLYVPFEENISIDLAAHEQVHMEQQKNPEEWWKKYFEDENFRTEQELQAYQVQYKTFCKQIKAKKERKKFLNRIASDLSGPIYGNCVSFEEAIEKIQQ